MGFDTYMPCGTCTVGIPGWCMWPAIGLVPRDGIPEAGTMVVPPGPAMRGVATDAGYVPRPVRLPYWREYAPDILAGGFLKEEDIPPWTE